MKYLTVYKLISILKSYPQDAIVYCAEEGNSYEITEDNVFYDEETHTVLID